MDAKTKDLVGIAAAVSGHCQKCFSYHYAEARKLGIAINEINETIDFAKAIRSSGNQAMNEFIQMIVSQKQS